MKTKFFTLFTALTLSAGALFASDTAVDGIYYNFDATNLTAIVTYRGSYSGSYADEYTGNVVIPATVTYGGNPYSVTSIGNGAFEYCSGLTSVTIPNSVTSIGEFAFSGCSSLTKTNYTGDIAGWCGINFGNYSANPTAYSYNLYINDVEVKDLMIPNSVTSIGNYAFSGCSGLTSITIPNSVTSIGEYAFKYCSSLTSVTIPNSVTSIGRSAFYGCSGLTSVTIPNSVTSIGSYAFYGCSGLTSVTIPNSVTSIGEYAFEECSGLISVTIPNSVTSIGMYAFEGCSGLTSVLWNAKNFADFSSRDYAPFYNIKSQITSFTFGSEVEHIPAYLCYGMENLTSVTIPNSVTRIGDYAFRGCSGLTSVTIGNSVTSIGKSAFGECTQLTNIVCYAAEPPSCDTSSFANYDASLKVPYSSLEAYKADAVWGLFNNISYIESTVGLEQIELAGLYTQAGRIVCNGEFRIYDLLGRDVTRLNGSLCGVYVVKSGNAAVKVMVK